MVHLFCMTVPYISVVSATYPSFQSNIPDLVASTLSPMCRTMANSIPHTRPRIAPEEKRGCAGMNWPFFLIIMSSMRGYCVRIEVARLIGDDCDSRKTNQFWIRYFRWIECCGACIGGRSCHILKIRYLISHTIEAILKNVIQIYELSSNIFFQVCSVRFGILRLKLRYICASYKVRTESSIVHVSAICAQFVHFPSIASK